MRIVLTGLVAAALLAPLAAWAQDPRGQSASGDGFDESRLQGTPKENVRKPIARKDFDATVQRMFNAVDTNRDGTVTLAEFQAIVSARKEQAIAGRFAAIDTDRNKSLSYAEFSAWQRTLGSVVLADSEAGGGVLVSEEIRPDPGRSAESAQIAGLVAPLSSNALVAANTNYDAGVSLAELIAYEGKRFDGLDTNHDGFLQDDELRPRTPIRAR